MTKFFLIIFILLTICNCTIKPAEYSIPKDQDINNIIEAIISEDTDLLYRIIKVDSNKESDRVRNRTEFTTREVLSIDLRKLKVIVPDKSIEKFITRNGIRLMPPVENNTVSIVKLLSTRINNRKFFNQLDSLYLLYQNDLLRNFVISKSISDKLETTTEAEQKKIFNLKQCNSYYDLTIPLISVDHSKAYVELTSNRYLCGSGAYAIYLENLHGKWRIIYKHELWTS